jgi:hypothetical protein
VEAVCEACCRQKYLYSTAGMLRQVFAWSPAQGPRAAFHVMQSMSYCLDRKPSSHNLPKLSSQVLRTQSQGRVLLPACSACMQVPTLALLPPHFPTGSEVALQLGNCDYKPRWMAGTSVNMCCAVFQSIVALHTMNACKAGAKALEHGT